MHLARLVLASVVLLVPAAGAQSNEIDPSLPRAKIGEVIRSMHEEVTKCYGYAMRDEPTKKEGVVTLDFTIGTEGRAEDVKLVSDTVGSKFLVGCMIMNVRKLQFPRPVKGVRVKYPWAFKNSPDAGG